VAIHDFQSFTLPALLATAGPWRDHYTFSQDARDYVRRIEKKIVLTNGKELAEFIIEHIVGVAVSKT
jgi:restriction system protein